MKATTTLILIILTSILNVNAMIVTREDGKIADYRPKIYQLTAQEQIRVESVVDTWYRINKHRSTTDFVNRSVNYILSKSHYENDGLKCYTEIGVLGGKAVCLGYSLFLQRMLDKKNIQNVLIWDRPNNHMYNRVNGKKIDVTEIEANRKYLQSILPKLRQLGITFSNDYIKNYGL